jgi:HEAT repeat protein
LKSIRKHLVRRKRAEKMELFDKLFGKKKEKKEGFNIHKLKEKRDIDGLMEVLREDPERGGASRVSLLSKAAISAIGEIGDERAINSLIQVLGWKKIVEKTLHSTEGGPSFEYDEKIGFFVTKKLVDEYTFTRIAAAETLAKVSEERGTEYLLQALKNDDFYVRKSAAISLANLGDKRAVKMLIECLRFHYVYIDVIEALGKLKPLEAVNPLIKILSKGSADKRCAAAEALGKIGDKKAVEPLIMALMEKPIGEKAAKALRDLGVEEDIIVRGSEFAAKREMPLLSVAGFPDEWEFAHRLAQIALGKPDIEKMERNGDVERLIRALEHEDSDIKYDAATALGRIGDARAVEPLIRALKGPLGGRAAEPLKEIGEPAVGALIQVLKYKDSNVRRNAAWTLGEIGDARAIEPLSELERHAERELREAAKEALKKIKAKKS